LGEVFKKVGLTVTSENRKQIENIIRSIVGGKDCPSTWRETKKRLSQDEAGFIEEFKTAWSNQQAH
jgi:hypothetical protein